MAANTSPENSNIIANPVTDTTATITWTTNVEGINTIEYGTTTAYGSSVTIDVSATISNIVATSNSDTSVTISWDLSEGATGQVEYGLTSNYGLFTTKETSFAFTHHSQVLSGLATGTTYHFVIISTDSSGNTSYSGDLTFTTTGANTNTLEVSNVVVSSITETGATISWSVNPAATGQIEYGPSDLYGALSTLEPSYLYSHSQVLSGLSSGTVYHFRILASDSTTSVMTADATFTTVANANTPVVSNIISTPSSATSEQISWDVFPACTGRIEYGLTTAYGSLSTLEPSYLNWHLQTLSGLTQNTLYHYRILGTDANFNNVATPDHTFTSGLSGTLTPPFFQEAETFLGPITIHSSNYTVQSVSSNGQAGAGTSVACSATYATGDTAVVFVTYGGAGSTTTSVSDGTNTYTQVGTELTDTAFNQRVDIFECINPTPGTYTVTCTYGASHNYLGIGVVVYSGFTGAAEDYSGNWQQAPATTANAVTSGNVTPTNVPACIIGMTLAEGSATISAGTDFASRGNFATLDTAFTNVTKIEDKTVSTTADVAATFTTSSSSLNTLTVALAYQIIPPTGFLTPNFWQEDEIFYAPELTESNRTHAVDFVLFDDIFFAPIITYINTVLDAPFFQELEIFYSPTIVYTQPFMNPNGRGTVDILSMN